MKMTNMLSIKLNLTKERVVVIIAAVLAVGVIIAAIFAKDVFIFKVKDENTILARPSQTFQDVSIYPNAKYKGLLLQSDVTRFRISDIGTDTNSIDVNLTFDVLAGVRTVELYLNQDNGQSQFSKKTIYNSFIENLQWDSFKDGDVTIWTKNKLTDTNTNVFSTTTAAPSRNAITFIPEYTPKTRFVDYQKNNSRKDVYFPVRGNFTMYVYVGDGEEFNLSVAKRDLNLYQGEDPLAIVIKNAQGGVVGEYKIEDDGITTISNIATSTQSIDINKGLPEGIYSVEFRQNDSIVETISTTLSKFVFGNSLFTANSSLYLGNPKSVTLYTKQRDNFATLMHDLKSQTLKLDDAVRGISKNDGRVALKSSKTDAKDFTKIEIPTGDILIESSGYFATSPDYYFNPNPIKVMQFKDYTSATPIDFVIARYEKPTRTDKGLYQTKVTLKRPDNSNTIINEVLLHVDKSLADSGVIIKELEIDR